MMSAVQLAENRYETLTRYPAIQSLARSLHSSDALLLAPPVDGVAHPTTAYVDLLLISHAGKSQGSAESLQNARTHIFRADSERLLRVRTISRPDCEEVELQMRDAVLGLSVPSLATATSSLPHRTRMLVHDLKDAVAICNPSVHEMMLARVRAESLAIVGASQDLHCGRSLSYDLQHAIAVGDTASANWVADQCLAAYMSAILNLAGRTNPRRQWLARLAGATIPDDSRSDLLTHARRLSSRRNTDVELLRPVLDEADLTIAVNLRREMDLSALSGHRIQLSPDQLEHGK